MSSFVVIINSEGFAAYSVAAGLVFPLRKDGKQVSGLELWREAAQQQNARRVDSVYKFASVYWKPCLQNQGYARLRHDLVDTAGPNACREEVASWREIRLCWLAERHGLKT